MVGIICILMYMGVMYMTLLDTKINFLNEHVNSKSYEGSYKVYEGKTDVFLNYLMEEKGINDKNYLAYLEGVDSNVICESIDYYVEKNRVNFKGTVELYKVVLFKFFEYLSANEGIKNRYFDSKENFNLLKDHVEKKINDLGLKEEKSREIISDDMFEIVLNSCDEVLNDYNLEQMLAKDPNEYNNPVQMYISSLITKLVLFVGLKNQVLTSLAVDDYDSELNILSVNKFDVHLPNNFSKQMKQYLALREKIVKKSNSGATSLFIMKDGSNIGSLTNNNFYILTKMEGNLTADGVAKFAIIQMLKEGIDTSVVKLLTGYGDTTIEHCLESFREISGENARNRLLNSKLRNLYAFDKM